MPQPRCARPDLGDRHPGPAQDWINRDRKEEQQYHRAALYLPWPDWSDVKKIIAVKVVAQDSPLKSLNFIILKIKDATANVSARNAHERPSVDTECRTCRCTPF